MKFSVLIAVAIMACSVMSAQPKWQWVVPIKGPTVDEVTSLAISPTNTLFATGMFSDSVDIGGLMLYPAGSQYDAFLASFTKSGNVRQSMAMGGIFTDESKSVVVDNQGNVYVAGGFIDSILVAGWIAYALGESSDMFVAKFDKQGAFQWIKSFGSPEYDEGSPFLAVDSVGNVYVAGGIGGTGTVQSKTHVSFGKSDAFIAKFNSAGEVVWLAAGGGTDYDNVVSVNVTPNGDRVYAAGFFHGGANFPQMPILNAFGSLSDFFVWAVNANGQSQWAKRIGSSKADNIISGAVDKDGKLLLTGAFFGETTFDTQKHNANGEFDSDVFLTRFSKAGLVEFVKKWGGVFGEVGTTVYGDKLGGIYVGGYYDSASVFDDVPLIEYGERDAFIMRCQPDGELEWIREAGGPHADEIRAIVVGTDNIPYAAGVFETSADFSGIHVLGEKLSEGFVGALECGPNTRLRPAITEFNICEGQDSSILAPAGYPSYQWYVNGVLSPSGSLRFRLSTLPQGQHTIYVTIRDRYGCSKNTDTISVTVRPGLAKPSITKVGTKLVTDAVAASYQWFREGSPIPGAKSAETNIVGDGLYQVRIMDEGGCTRLSDPYVEGSTGVGDDDGFFSGMTVFPNPTNGTLNIRGLNGECEIIIVNTLGLPVYRGVHANEHVTLDLSTMVAGAYTVTIRNGHHTTAHRIVRQ